MQEDRLSINSIEGVDKETLSRGATSILLLPQGWPTKEDVTIYAESTDSVFELFTQQGVPAETLSPITEETTLTEDRYAIETSAAPPALFAIELATSNP